LIVSEKQGEDFADIVKVLEGLAGLPIVVDENTWFRWQALLRHQVKAEPQVSERAKGLRCTAFLFPRVNEEDLDGTACGTRGIGRDNSFTFTPGA
jgi:hypothetical protein